MFVNIKNIIFSLCILIMFILTSCGGSVGGSAQISSSSNSSSADGPSVTIINPQNNSINNSLTPSIQLQFSESVNNVNIKTVVLVKNSPTGVPVLISDLVLGANNIYSFSPEYDLQPNTSYYVIISNDITSISSGLPLPRTTFNFTTGNSSAPTVALIYPNNGAVDVSLTPNIQFKFSKAVANVNVRTVTLHAGDPKGPMVLDTTLNYGGNNTYILTPSYLYESTLYYLNFSNQIVSVGQNESIEATQFSFTTGLSVNSLPSVTMLSPTNNSHVETLNPMIRLKFSESVVGVDKYTIILHKDKSTGIPVPINAITLESDNIYSFTSAESLNPYTNYFIEVKKGIYALSNKAPVMPSIFNFNITGPRFGYIIDELGISVCNINPTTGEFKTDTCTVTLAGNGSKIPNSITFNQAHTYAYVTMTFSSSIIQCSLDRATGKLEACINTGDNLYSPDSIALTANGKFAYVANFSGGVSVCSVIESTGAIFGCTDAGNMIVSMYAQTIVLDLTDSYVFVADPMSRAVNACTLNATDGKFSICKLEYENWTPSGLAVTSDNRYLYTVSDSFFVGCVIYHNNGLLGICDNTSENIFTRLNNITIDGHNIYVTDSGNGAVSLCKLDPTTDGVKHCVFAALNRRNVLGVKILSN